MSNTADPDRVSRHRHTPSQPRRTDNPSLRPLLVFAAVAIPTGWVLLSAYQFLGLPQAPFVLATLLIGLILPAIVLTSRESGGKGVRALLRDAVRLPRPLWWAPFAALVLPILVWLGANLLGGAPPITSALVKDVGIGFLSSLLIINIWEEMAWTGFVQRRAMARWGLVAGSVVTAVLFAGIHFPLVFDGADTAGGVTYNLLLLLGTAVGLRLIIAGLDGWSGRSLLTIGILHAAYNSTADLTDPDHGWVRLLITLVLGVAVAAAITRHPQ